MDSGQERMRGNIMIGFLTRAMVMFPLLNLVPAEAAPLGIPESHAPLINQTEDHAIVKVAEGCGTGYFRDGYGQCRYYGYGAPPAPPDEACPPDRHFEHWANHRGGFCKLN
jgi:hypothetical protein